MKKRTIQEVANFFGVPMEWTGREVMFRIGEYVLSPRVQNLIELPDTHYVVKFEPENARMNIAQGAEQMSCKYCESKELVYLEKSEYVDLWMHGTELGASGESEAIKNINFCPMCGRKLEDV
jgi:hypothetical protein